MNLTRFMAFGTIAASRQLRVIPTCKIRSLPRSSRARVTRPCLTQSPDLRLAVYADSRKLLDEIRAGDEHVEGHDLGCDKPWTAASLHLNVGSVTSHTSSTEVSGRCDVAVKTRSCPEVHTETPSQPGQAV